MFKWVTVFALLVATTVFVAIPARPASANDGAIINHHVAGAGLLDGNGNVQRATACSILVAPNGKAKLTCSAEGLPNASGRAVFWNNQNTNRLCGVTLNGVLYVTPDWHETVSASGNAHLVAFFDLN